MAFLRGSSFSFLAHPSRGGGITLSTSTKQRQLQYFESFGWLNTAAAKAGSSGDATHR